MKMIKIIYFAVFVIFSNFLNAQKNYEFTTVNVLSATSVKNQGMTGTCWCYSPVSLFESDLIKKGFKDIDLSEMYIVRKAYTEKAAMYVRMHGKSNFDQGGETHDALNVIRKYGIMPQSAYDGKNNKEEVYNHAKLIVELKTYLDTLIVNKADKLPVDWLKDYELILDKYFGVVPASFEYNGDSYSAKSFLNNYLKINPDDYVEFSSYSHHPFNQKFFLEIPDNWSFDLYNNIPIDDLIQVIDSSILKGYTVAWGGDVSEIEFSTKKAIAIIPAKEWSNKSEQEREKTCVIKEDELNITQEMRQTTFDNYTSTDDHFMHIIGIAIDQLGDKYYITKNSWGSVGAKNGFIYLSEPFVRLKTLSIMVNKKAVSQKILLENGLK